MNSKALAIDTGAPRSVAGHVVSGALASGALASAINYGKYKKEELSTQGAVQNTLKLSLQGGIATGSAISAANYLGKGNILGALSAISIGAMGVYATELISEKLEQRDLIEDEEVEMITEKVENN